MPQRLSEIEFDRIFKNRGGRLLTPPAPYRSLIDFALNFSRETIKNLRNSDNSFPNVYLDIINSSKINASATIDTNGDYFIGINFATLIIIQDVFFRMLSHKSIFPEIGDVSKEKNIHKIFNLQVTNLEDFILNRPDELMVVPQDSKRLLFAQTLTAIVIDFLVSHEYGHIVRGHVGYLNSIISSFNLNEVQEIDFTDDSPVNTLFMQTLEMDADSFATASGMIKLQMLNKNIQFVDPHVREFYKDWPTMLKIWIFAVCSFYKIIGHKSEKNSITYNNSHPPPSIRTAFIQTTLHEVLLEKNIGLNEHEIEKICIDTWDKTDRAFSEASYSEFDLFEMEFVTTAESVRIANSIMSNWGVVAPLIQTFAFHNFTK